MEASARWSTQEFRRSGTLSSILAVVLAVILASLSAAPAGNDPGSGHGHRLTLAGEWQLEGAEAGIGSGP